MLKITQMRKLIFGARSSKIQRGFQIQLPLEFLLPKHYVQNISSLTNSGQFANVRTKVKGSTFPSLK